MSYSEFEAAVHRRLLRSSIRLGDLEVSAGINRWWNRTSGRGLSWDNSIRRCVEGIRESVLKRLDVEDHRPQRERTVELW